VVLPLVFEKEAPVISPASRMHSNTGGRWSAMCGRCLLSSPTVAAMSAEATWEHLTTLGWRWYVSEFGGPGYAECGACSKADHSLSAAVKRAHKSRKRK
jgi:hypothetical protein